VRLRIPSKAGVKARAGALAVWTRRRLARAQARERLRRSLPQHAKVQLGCGRRPFAGWVNIDLERGVHPDVRVDLRGGFPAPAGSVAFIYSEHVFEHLTLGDGRRVFADCQAALEPGGVMRIAMPDLRYIVERYLEGRYDGEAGPEAEGDAFYRSIDSAALLLNHALRAWGHLYLYDFNELSLRLRQAGFTSIESQTPGKSSHQELEGREQRGASRLVVEARK
jgi:predicted SAM-dependent methyltransferase